MTDSDTRPWAGWCGTSSCVEAAPDFEGGVLIRAARTLPGEELDVTAAEWWQFLDAVKAGAFDDVLPRAVTL